MLLRLLANALVPARDRMGELGSCSCLGSLRRERGGERGADAEKGRRGGGGGDAKALHNLGRQERRGHGRGSWGSVSAVIIIIALTDIFGDVLHMADTGLRRRVLVLGGRGCRNKDRLYAGQGRGQANIEVGAWRGRVQSRGIGRGG